MGNCGSSPDSAIPADVEARGSGGIAEDEMAERRSKALDKEMRDLERRQASEIKILLLGKCFSYRQTKLRSLDVALS